MALFHLHRSPFWFRHAVFALLPSNSEVGILVHLYMIFLGLIISLKCIEDWYEDGERTLEIKLMRTVYRSIDLIGLVYT